MAQDIGETSGALGYIIGNSVQPTAPLNGPPAIGGTSELQNLSVNFLPDESELAPDEAKVLLIAQKYGTATSAGFAGNTMLIEDSSPVLAGLSITGPIPVLQTFAGPGFVGGVPPDPIAAAGPEQVVALVNTSIGIYDKVTGDELFLQSVNGLSGFFAEAGATTTVFDPWILFDTETDRFFALGIDVASESESNVFLAISTDSTPTGGDDWHKYKIDFTHVADGTGLGTGAHFPDYPKMCVSDDAIWISGNYFPIFSGSNVYAGITAIEKEPLLTGGPANIVYEEFFDGFSVMPMTQYDSATVEYLAEASSFGGNTITIHSVSNVLTSPTRTTSVVTVPQYLAPVDVPQLGGGTAADSIDARVMTGVWRNGSMWFGHAITDPAVGDGESLVRLFEIDTNDVLRGGTPQLVQSGNVDPGPGMHAWMPAVAFGETVQTITEYLTGLDNYQITDGGGRNRWGDYSGLAIDPSDDATFWAFNEYASISNTWATQFASFQLQQPTDEDWHQFAVQSGDILRIQTFAPGDGPLEIVNDLDPDFELFDPNENLIPHANSTGNELLFHVAQTSGQYRLRMYAEYSEGEYFVQVEGATGSSLPPTVIDANPDTGNVVSEFPPTYTLTFSEGLLIPTLSGAVLDLQGEGNDAFTSVFELDATPRVILSTLWNGLPLRASRPCCHHGP